MATDREFKVAGVSCNGGKYKVKDDFSYRDWETDRKSNV